MLSNHPDNLMRYSENVWLTKPYPTGKRQDCLIGVCVAQDDGSFASVDLLRLDDAGNYYAKKAKLGQIDSGALKEYIEAITRKSTFTPHENPVYNEMSEFYLQTASIKQTARRFGVSEQSTRKILITTGVFTSELYEKIKSMLESGKTVDEISAELKIQKKQIAAHLPY